eukprot:Amastigsp_a843794_10.p3 type:complete len:196 gc:universal Amastigsp_a843794_10:1275-688(-)
MRESLRALWVPLCVVPLSRSSLALIASCVREAPRLRSTRFCTGACGRVRLRPRSNISFELAILSLMWSTLTRSRRCASLLLRATRKHCECFCRWARTPSALWRTARRRSRSRARTAIWKSFVFLRRLCTFARTHLPGFELHSLRRRVLGLWRWSATSSRLWAFARRPTTLSARFSTRAARRSRSTLLRIAMWIGD